MNDFFGRKPLIGIAYRCQYFIKHWESLSAQRKPCGQARGVTSERSGTLGADVEPSPEPSCCVLALCGAPSSSPASHLRGEAPRGRVAVRHRACWSSSSRLCTSPGPKRSETPALAARLHAQAKEEHGAGRLSRCLWLG